MFELIKKKKCPPPYRGVRPEKLLSDQMVVTTKDVYYPALSGNKKYQIWSRAFQVAFKFGLIFCAIIILLFFIVKWDKKHPKHRIKSTKSRKNTENVLPKKEMLTASLYQISNN